MPNGANPHALSAAWAPSVVVGRNGRQYGPTHARPVCATPTEWRPPLRRLSRQRADKAGRRWPIDAP
eukprot:11194295-Lingulodinium_polyedra.AAC.1